MANVLRVTLPHHAAGGAWAATEAALVGVSEGSVTDFAALAQTMATIAGRPAQGLQGLEWAADPQVFFSDILPNIASLALDLQRLYPTAADAPLYLEPGIQQGVSVSKHQVGKCPLHYFAGAVSASELRPTHPPNRPNCPSVPRQAAAILAHAFFGTLGEPDSRFDHPMRLSFEHW